MLCVLYFTIVSRFVYYILLVFYLYFLCNIVTLCECHSEIKGYLLTYLHQLVTDGRMGEHCASTAPGLC